MTKISRHDFDIPCLGPAEFPSPLQHRRYQMDAEFMTDDGHRVLFSHSLEKVCEGLENENGPATIEHAGARERIFFNPAQTICAVVTCGGLCPGLNDVIRGLVMTLNYSYGVRTIYGIPYGYEGFIPKYGHIAFEPDARLCQRSESGRRLGAGQFARAAVEERKLSIFWSNTGSTSSSSSAETARLRGAQDIVAEVTKRDLKISVVGIPKTIDNDLEYMDKSFGFETAFAEAVRTVRCAHSEAQGYPNGVGLVKLMGRDSGFIAAFAALAENSVNYVLIPEVPFQLRASTGCSRAWKIGSPRRGHAVVVVAEGAGQHLMQSDPSATDASGNLKYGDIGPFLKKADRESFQGEREGNQHQVYRSELRHSQRAGFAAGRDLLPAPGPECSPRRDGGQDEHGRRPLAWPLRQPADERRHRAAAEGQPAGRFVGHGAGSHWPAGGI